MNFEKWWATNPPLKNKSSQSLAAHAFAKEAARLAWQAAQPQWQPIETAPQDKTMVDIYSKSLGRLCDYQLNFNGSGHKFYMGLGESGFVVWDATHFMLIPQPPESKND